MMYQKMRHKTYLMRTSTMEITKREVIASVVIIAIMLMIGFAISGKISDYQNDKNAEYQKAIHVSDHEMFEYGMQTNVGNAFVYGDLKAVDTVTYPEIDGQYMYVEKIKEKYTQHTRTVTYTTGSGKNRQTHTRVETYWTWDKVGSEDKMCKEISFCEVIFDSNKIDLPGTNYIDTVKESSRIRYKYYGVNTQYTGTLYTSLKDNTITNNSKFYNEMSIDEALEHCTSNIGLPMFWVIWIALIAAAVYSFYYLDNRWLED